MSVALKSDKFAKAATVLVEKKKCKIEENKIIIFKSKAIQMFIINVTQKLIPTKYSFDTNT